MSGEICIVKCSLIDLTNVVAHPERLKASRSVGSNECETQQILTKKPRLETLAFLMSDLRSNLDRRSLFGGYF
jgi:hypothetical protein